MNFLNNPKPSLIFSKLPTYCASVNIRQRFEQTGENDSHLDKTNEYYDFSRRYKTTATRGFHTLQRIKVFIAQRKREPTNFKLSCNNFFSNLNKTSFRVVNIFTTRGVLSQSDLRFKINKVISIRYYTSFILTSPTNTSEFCIITYLKSYYQVGIDTILLFEF